MESNTSLNEHEKVNILMVDDQPAKLLSYEIILSELGENLIKAGSGREALGQLLKTDVALVLMDVSMPELDGFELAEIIRQHPRYQKTAVIFISAVHLTDLDRLKGYKHGAVDYISVPVIPELLRAKVSVFAELYRKTRQLERLNSELERRVAERTEELERRVTELARLNTALQSSNQELDAFTYIASHDMKEPLRNIANLGQFLLEDSALQLNEQSEDRVRSIQRLCQRLDGFLNALLEYSRIGRAEATQTRVNLDEVVQDSLELVAPPPQVVVHVQRPLGMVWGNDIQLTQVFANLVGNGLKYTDQATPRVEIGVQAAEQNGLLVYSVRDNGIGIAPEHQEAIFQIFKRLHPRDAFGGGRGVGLTIVKKIIERHGGRIWVESQPGVGTTFFFTLTSAPKEDQEK